MCVCESDDGDGGVHVLQSIMINGDEQYVTSEPDRTRPKTRNEQLWVYCERRSERGRKAGCYFSPGVVMETAASLQMETSRTHGSSNKWLA